MKADRRKLRELAARLEGELWWAGREEEVSSLSPGFTAGVMRRIREERAARAPRNLLELLGEYSWRLAPAAAGVLVLIAALGFLIPSGRGWSASLNGGDIFVRWMLQEYDSPAGGGRP